MMRLKGGSIWGGYLMPWDRFVYGVEVGQRYLMENTTLGMPALIQSEGQYLLLPIHNFTVTIFPNSLRLICALVV